MTNQEKRGLTGTALKTIAALSMFIDHLGAIVYPSCYVAVGGYLWPVLRIFGRLAFPIYAFLAAEGVAHTKNIKAYAGRMLALAILSEPIYDYVFRGSFLEVTNQNILFTLLIGIVTLEAAKYFRLRGKDLFVYGVLAAGCVAAEFTYCDYGAIGIITMILFSNLFMTEKEHPLKLLFASMFHVIAGGYLQGFAALAAIPLWFYNGKRGCNHPVIQWGCYLFYPAHLILLWGLCFWLK